MDVLLLMPSTLDGIIHKSNQTSCYNNTGIISEGYLLSNAEIYLLGEIVLAMYLFIDDP